MRALSSGVPASRKGVCLFCNPPINFEARPIYFGRELSSSQLTNSILGFSTGLEHLGLSTDLKMVSFHWVTLYKYVKKFQSSAACVVDVVFMDRKNEANDSGSRIKLF